ncbi:MAG: MCE family protein [Actinobacteria bacterium]|nr:MAG: MCE family protein [Actinomycetota bacterium]
MRRRGSASIVANPVLVGAVTTLVVVVAVFLSYNANNGLPFVPTRSVFVEMKNGSELVRGNDVREGGFRVGVVEEMVPAQMENGHVGARLKLKLDRKVGDLPADTTFQIRQRGSLGLKYVEIDRGRSRKTLPDGATVRLSQTRTPVDLDRVYNMFDAKTRRAAGQDLVGYGNAFVGRGNDLHDFIDRAPRLVRVLEPVMRNLSDPRTDLAGFFSSLERTTRTVAPVAKTYARTFKEQADTFAAIDADPASLKATISKNPPTLDVSTRSLRVQTPFLQDSAKFGRDLNAAVQELRPTLPVVNSALEIGTPVQRRSVALNSDLQQALGALRDLATAPTTNAALLGLTDTVATLQPTLRYLGPFVTVCNYWNYFWTLAAEHLSARIGTGSAERAMLNTQGNQANSVGSQGAVLPAAGLQIRDGDPQFMHSPAYPSAITSDGAADCEAGQQGYPNAANKFTEFKNPNYQHVVEDPNHSEGSPSGPTYRRLDDQGKGDGLNPDHVPAGETFSAQPGGSGAKVATP